MGFISAFGGFLTDPKGSKLFGDIVPKRGVLLNLNIDKGSHLKWSYVTKLWTMDTWKGGDQSHFYLYIDLDMASLTTKDHHK